MGSVLASLKVQFRPVQLILPIFADGREFTLCCADPELPLKPELPWYVAVKVWGPEFVRASEQLPVPSAPRGALQLSVSSLTLTITVPSGVPAPEVTVKPTVTASPGLDGSGLWPVMVVVVAAGGGGLTV